MKIVLAQIIIHCFPLRECKFNTVEFFMSKKKGRKQREVSKGTVLRMGMGWTFCIMTFTQMAWDVGILFTGSFSPKGFPSFCHWAIFGIKKLYAGTIIQPVQ